jgi:hypothetical protein
MKVKNYIIKFSYDREFNQIDKTYKLGGETICLIETPEYVTTGKAICSEKDVFCKDTGRKIALKEALKYSDASKKDRKEIWEVYRNTTKEPKW